MDSREFRDISGCFVTGVTVITTVDQTGAPVGMTANSFSSLSLDPPLIMFGIAKTASLYDAFIASSGFVINILANAQLHIAQQFAKRGIDRFAGVDYELSPNGYPVLGNVLAHFDCKFVTSYEGGDHSILIGEVTSGSLIEGEPLAFYRGTYQTQITHS